MFWIMFEDCNTGELFTVMIFLDEDGSVTRLIWDCEREDTEAINQLTLEQYLSDDDFVGLMDFHGFEYYNHIEGLQWTD